MAVNPLAQSVRLFDGRSARGPDYDATTGRKATAGEKHTVVVGWSVVSSS